MSLDAQAGWMFTGLLALCVFGIWGGIATAVGYFVAKWLCEPY
jgi:hypothetical protein